MKYRITAPRSIQGRACLPASKSISNRALILQALAGGESAALRNLSDCDDTFVMIRALEHPQAELVDIMAAGTAMRFLTAYYAVTPGTRTLTGTERMRQRPIHLLVDALRTLGADIQYAGEEGFPPLRITGRRLSGNSLTLPAGVSSQYISALLMIAPLLPEGLTLRLTGTVISRPYIDLTLQMMRTFGAKAGWESDPDAVLRVEPVPYRPTPYTVENDWSAASYWYEMLFLAPEGGTLFLPHLHEKSMQGDSHVAQLFAPLGIHTTYTDEGITLSRTAACIEPGGVYEENFLQCPDLAQTFVAACPPMGISFRFGGLQSLKIKETDRIAALRREMGKLHYAIEETESAQEGTVLFHQSDNTLDNHPATAEADAPIATYKDHRMAMAFAPLALRLPYIEISDPAVVSKSYPSYWDELRKAGFRIEESEE